MGFREVWQGAQAANNPYANLSAGDQQGIDDFNKSFYSGPNYTGRHETGQFLDSQLGNLYGQWAHEAPLDYSGEAQIGQFYNNKAQQLSSLLAARGIGGSGIEGGAQATNIGNEGNSVGNYIRGIVGQRAAQHAAQLNQFNQLAASLGVQGLQGNINKQKNKGGFWKDLLGVAGTVGGTLLGGPAGGKIGGAIGGLFGGHQSNNGYSDYGQPGGSYDPYQDAQPWQGQADIPSWMMQS